MAPENLDLNLEDLRWLERLALRLVADPEEARDLSQEALLAAHMSSEVPSEVASESAGERRRRWLSGTIRRLAAKAARRRGRRMGYEKEGARAEALPSPEQLVERAESHERLLRQVRSLPDGYRTPLMLRYYDGASPSEIAAALDLPVRTVHTRLHRGLKLLRERLDQDHPDGREGWLAALLPVGLGSVGEPGYTVEPLMLMSSGAAAAAGPIQWVLGMALALAAAGVWILGATGDVIPGGIGTNVRLTAIDAPLEPDGTPDTQLLPPVVGRRALGAKEPSPAPDSRAPLAIEVIDWDSRPVAGAQLTAAPFLGIQLPGRAHLPLELLQGPETSIDVPTNAWGVALLRPDGDAKDPQPDTDQVFGARLFGHVTAVAATFRVSSSGPAPFVVVAPSRSLSVTVLGPDGAPLDQLRAWVLFEEDVAVRFERPLASSYPEHWLGRVEGSTVHFDAVPDVREARLVVEAAGYPVETRRLDEVPSTLYLGSSTPGLVGVSGRLVDGFGQGASGSILSADGLRVESAAGGEFSLAVGEAVDHLWVVARGRAPRLVPLGQTPVGGRADLGVRKTDAVQLGSVRLGPASAALEGRVVNEAGRPLANIVVWPEGLTRVPAGRSSVILEGIAAGGSGQAHHARTGEDGRFRLEGLDGERSYTLRMLDERTARWDRIPPARPGEALRVIFAAGRELCVAAGRVVDDLGRPVARATIRVKGPGHGQGASPAYAVDVAAATSADGHFELPGVPAAGVTLVIRHPDLTPAEASVERFGSGHPRASRDWVVPRAAMLRVMLQDVKRADEVEALRADGGVVALRRPVGLGYAEEASVPLRAGRTAVLGFGCDARTIVLRLKGRVVDQVAIQPIPGEVLLVDV